jgi:hypothetical protein
MGPTSGGLLLPVPARSAARSFRLMVLLVPTCCRRRGVPVQINAGTDPIVAPAQARAGAAAQRAGAAVDDRLIGEPWSDTKDLEVGERFLVGWPPQADRRTGTRTCWSFFSTARHRSIALVINRRAALLVGAASSSAGRRQLGRPRLGTGVMLSAASNRSACSSPNACFRTERRHGLPDSTRAPLCHHGLVPQGHFPRSAAGEPVPKPSSTPLTLIEAPTCCATS